MDDAEERMRILEMIESGKINASQGLSLLQALQAPAADQPEEEDLPPPGQETPAWQGPPAAAASPQTGDVLDREADERQTLRRRADRLRRWWIVLLLIGIDLALLGGWLLYAAFQRSGIAAGLLFVCALFPLALGALGIILAWASRAAPWLHLRLQQAPGARPQRIVLSLPLPLGLGVWLVRSFGRFIPGMHDQPLEEVFQLVQQTTVTGNPIHVEVDEGEKGEKVEILIG